MSQTVPTFDCSRAEMGSSLAELDFSILSDYHVPSPGRLPASYESSPPRLFGSPQREEADCGYHGAPRSPPLKQEFPMAAGMIKKEYESYCGDEGTPRSPFSDGGYSSQGGSPASQPLSPPPAYPHYPTSPQHYPGSPQGYPASPAQGYPASPAQGYSSPPHGYPASPPQGYPHGFPAASPPSGFGAGFPAGFASPQEQALRQCAQQRRSSLPFGLDILGEGGSEADGARLLDLALEQIRMEKENVCRLLGIGPDPAQWTVDQVRAWIAYTCQQSRLPPPPLDWLNVDGRTLCTLSEQQFSMALPPQCGELLAQLEVLRADQRRPGPLAWAVKQEPSEPTAADAADEADSDDEDERAAPVRGGSHIHLWQFLKELLAQPQLYGSSIRWIDRQAGIFKIEDSVRVAKLWGKRKNRPAMNYDKLSRSIRQYYKKGMMKKTERSQRLVYQFCHPYSL